jgi:hypothetical protein
MIPARRPQVPTARARALLAGIALLAAGCGAAAGEPVRILSVEPSPALADGPLVFRGAVEIAPDGGRIGGLSGIAVDAGGEEAVALSDVGRTVRLRLSFSADGRLAGGEVLDVSPLAGEGGAPVAGRRRDSEDLAVLPDGRRAVTFERDHRILLYPAGPGALASGPDGVLRPPGAEDLPSNGGLEALAALPDGRLVAIAEGPDDGAAERPAWIHGPGGWTRRTYLAEPGHRPTGAAALPDGGILVLERRFSIFGGLGGRIVRVPPEALAGDGPIEGHELVQLSPPLPVANYEGVAAVPLPDGRLRVLVVADDNFDARLDTVLLAFELRD